MKNGIAITILLITLAGCQQIPDYKLSGARGPVIYCIDCGIVAGRASKCPVEGDHHFKKSSGTSIIVCADCGAMPSKKGTKCPVEGDHHFREFE